MTRASFCNFCNFFLQLPTAYQILKIYVVQRFEVFPGILYCNFLQLFRFLRAAFIAIFINYCAKCKRVIKKILQNYFSLVLFSLIA